MPYYEWVDKTTGYQIDVLRPLSEYDKPPMEGELPEEERGKPREWERQLGSNQSSIGFGMKGYWILAFLLLHPGLLRGEEFRLLDTEHVSVDTWKTKARRDPYQPHLTSRWTNGTAFNLDLRMLEIFRWENKLHMDAVESSLRNAGWEFHLLMDWSKYIQPFYYHHSEHALDEAGTDSPYTNKDFPVKDYYGIRIIFLDKGRK